MPGYTVFTGGMRVQARAVVGAPDVYPARSECVSYFAAHSECVPSGLCVNRSTPSRLTDLLMSSNQVSGNFSVPYCSSMVNLDIGVRAQQSERGCSAPGFCVLCPDA
eukprot:364833-Chlamydomonas_euryale.AAC.26